MTNEPMNRVVSVDVLTTRDNVPRYEPVDHERYYHCIASSFVADGGDGFKMISKHKRNHKYVQAYIKNPIFSKYLLFSPTNL